MGFPLPQYLSLDMNNGSWPDRDITQINPVPINAEQTVGPRNPWKVFPSQEGAPHTHLLHFMKPSVLRVEEYLLEKIFGSNRVLRRFEREFKVVLQMRKPDSNGKVEILIRGLYWYRKRAKRLIKTLAKKFRNKQYRDIMKSFERKNVHSSAFLSDTVMNKLDEAVQSLEIGQETVQEEVIQTM